MHGEAHFGPWPHDGVPERFVSLRQMPWLDLEHAGDDGNSERSALCVTGGGFLVYAWAEAATSARLAELLRACGCVGALSLHEAPQGLALLGGGREDEATRLAKSMSLDPLAPLRGSAHDFVYLVRRDPTPHMGGGLSWTAAKGEQPPPSWLAAVHRSQTDKLGTDVEIYAFEPGRFRWQIRPGERERAGRTAEGALSPAEHARAMIAVGLGVAFRRDNRRGLALDGVVSLLIRPDLGVLTTSPRGDIAIARSLDEMAPWGDATELVLLAEAGEVRSEARKLGARRSRAAACIIRDGTLLVALATFDSSEPSTQALLDLGCRRVVELNRGRQVKAFVHRAGTDTPPQSEYEDTTLYGMAREANGTARLF
jgi:hypothetical protein